MKSRWTCTRGAKDALTITPEGDWTIAAARELYQQVRAARAEAASEVLLDGSKLARMDTTGAFLLRKLTVAIAGLDAPVSRRGFSAESEKLYRLIETRGVLDAAPPPARLGFLGRLGRFAVRLGVESFQLAAFLGRVFTEFGRALAHPRLLRVRELFAQLERVCVDALGIVALVMALIGVVVAYLFAIQLVKYGANIFLVDGVALAVTRELSPIVVAIIMAGRSGSAFTAQIGTMKMSEEIDAMVTMGLSPMQVLVLPRTLALMVALPLLTFFGDLIGLAGGMLIAHTYVGVNAASFIRRIYENFPIESFYIGLGKAPVFALFIGVIGCKLGLTVQDNAQSVGLHTTATVVRSIVLIIILDALFAVLFASTGFVKT